MKKALLLIMLTVLILGCEEKEITNFEECATAGNPVMESYPRQCRSGDMIFVEEIDVARTMSEELCTDAGGNWNECSNRCMLDNQGKEGVMCITLCEPLCECAGKIGYKCPEGYTCKTPEGVIDALGYCIE